MHRKGHNVTPARQASRAGAGKTQGYKLEILGHVTCDVVTL